MIKQQFADIRVDRLHLTAKKDDAVPRFPINSKSIWYDMDKIPLVAPEPAEYPGGEIYGVVRGVSNLKLVALKGREGIFVPENPNEKIEDVVMSNIYGDTYSPHFVDKDGDMFQKKSGWFLDGINNMLMVILNQSRGVVTVDPPLYLTYWKYVGRTSTGEPISTNSSGKSFTISASPDMVSGYTITMPLALPAEDSVMSTDSEGNSKWVNFLDLVDDRIKEMSTHNTERIETIEEEFVTVRRHAREDEYEKESYQNTISNQMGELRNAIQSVKEDLVPSNQFKEIQEEMTRITETVSHNNSTEDDRIITVDQVNEIREEVSRLSEKIDELSSTTVNINSYQEMLTNQEQVYQDIRDLQDNDTVVHKGLANILEKIEDLTVIIDKRDREMEETLALIKKDIGLDKNESDIKELIDITSSQKKSINDLIYQHKELSEEVHQIVIKEPKIASGHDLTDLAGKVVTIKQKNDLLSNENRQDIDNLRSQLEKLQTALGDIKEIVLPRERDDDLILPPGVTARSGISRNAQRIVFLNTVSKNSALNYSSDGGVTMTPCNAPKNAITSIAFSGLRFVATIKDNQNYRFMTSEDGKEWDLLKNIGLVGWGPSGGEIIHNGTEFVAIATSVPGSKRSAQIARSPDGLVWSLTKNPNPCGALVTGLTSNGKTHIIYGTDSVKPYKIYASDDWEHWQEISTTENAFAGDVVWCGNRFVMSCNMTISNRNPRFNIGYSKDGYKWIYMKAKTGNFGRCTYNPEEKLYYFPCFSMTGGRFLTTGDFKTFVWRAYKKLVFASGVFWTGKKLLLSDYVNFMYAVNRDDEMTDWHYYHETNYMINNVVG